MFSLMWEEYYNKKYPTSLLITIVLVAFSQVLSLYFCIYSVEGVDLGDTYII